MPVPQSNRPTPTSGGAGNSSAPDCWAVLAAQAPVALVLLDRHLCVQSASDRWLADCGWAQVPVGRPYLECLPVAVPDWAEALQRCLTGTAVEQPAIALAWLHDQPVQLRWRAQPWRDRDNQLGGAIVWHELSAAEDSRPAELGRQPAPTWNNIFNAERQQAEVALRTSKRYYQTLAETAPVAIFNTDASGRCVYANQQACILTGLPSQAWQGSDWLRLVHAEDRPRVQLEWQTAAQSSYLFQSEFRVQRPDCAQRWVYAQAQAIVEPQQAERASGYVVTCTDVTARKQFEEALQQSEARNRAIVAAIPDLMMRIDQAGYYRDYIAARDFPEPLERDRLGKHLREILPPDLAEQLFHYLQQALATGETQVFETQLIAGEQCYDQEIRVAVSGPDEVLVIVRDISDRKRAEAALQRFQQAVESASDAIAIADLNGRTLYFNAAFAQLYDHANVSDLEAWGGLAATFVDADAMTGLFSTALGGGTWSHEVEQRSRQGQPLHVLLRASPIQTETGRVVGFATLATDISERKASEASLRQQTRDLEQTLHELRRTQAQLVQTEKMSSLGQLVAGVAHEINNPVNFIYGNINHARDYTHDLIGLIELYQQHYRVPAAAIAREIDAIDLEFLVDDLPKLLHSMQVGAERIKGIVASLRNFSRMDEAEMKAVNVRDGIDSTLTILHNRVKGSAAHPGIEVVKHYADLPPTECYAGQLNQVFMNVLSNAIDALEERDRQRSLEECQASPSRIEIQTAQRADGWIEIRIRDNGRGIPPDRLPRLFDPFYTTKPIGKGTGLGLSISYQIVTEKHGGQLECRSTLGEGTEFTIAIPSRQGRSPADSAAV